MVRGPSYWFTGADVVAIARVGLVLVGGGLCALYAALLVTPPVAAITAYILAVLLLLSLPMLRSADLFAVVAIWMTVGEFAAAIAGDRVDGLRWLYAMGALGAAVLPLRAQRLRGLAIANPYRILARADRRTHRRPDPAPVDLHAERVPGDQPLLPAPADF